MTLMKMKDVCLKIGSGATPRGGKGAYVDSGISLIRSQNVLDFSFSYDGLAHITEEQADKLNNVIVESGDVLLNITGDSVARVCMVDDKALPARVNQHVAIVRANRQYVLDSYILYFLQMSKPLLLQLASGGATRNALTKSMIEELLLDVPSLAEQKRIVALIDNIQRKINNNSLINQNLLQQVTAIFHDYFDEYEFSSVDTMLLGDVARFKYGTMPKKDKLGRGEYVAFSGYQVVGSYPEKMFSDPQLIIVARGVGGCGDIKYTPADCYLTNLSIAIMTSSVAMEDYLFNYLRLHDTRVMNTGSAQPQITVSTLEKYQLPIPPTDRLQSFSALVQPYKSMYRKNKDENERLQMLRDTLLPRLMTGELDVSEIEL